MELEVFFTIIQQTYSKLVISCYRDAKFKMNQCFFEKIIFSSRHNSVTRIFFPNNFP
jgi:hypothetical protein